MRAAAELQDPDAARIAAFLGTIGIGLVVETLPPDTFLSGLAIRNGRLIVDPDRLEWPGDLLHEAGHIAVTDPVLRSALNRVSDDGGEEMAAIAWSWAAAQAIGLDAAVLFHPGGYHGGSNALIENFGSGRYFGVPLLQYFEMSYEPGRSPPGVAPYPHMLRWLR